MRESWSIFQDHLYEFFLPPTHFRSTALGWTLHPVGKEKLACGEGWPACSSSGAACLSQAFVSL